MDYLKDRARRLYERRHLAGMVPHEDRSNDQFHPEAGACHTNVDQWCRLNPTHKPVRGWLVFDHSAVGRFLFVAHSVVEDEKGNRFDVTPQRPIGQYGFLQDEAFDEEYMLLIQPTSATKSANNGSEPRSGLAA